MVAVSLGRAIDLDIGVGAAVGRPSGTKKFERLLVDPLRLVAEKKN